MIHRLVLAGAAILALAAAAPAVPTGPVTLRQQPGTALDATARRVAGADISDGDRGALLLLGSQRLGTAGIGPALFVQVQSARSCGSAGCSTSVYLPTAKGWQKVLDSVGSPIVVDKAVHRGMHDLVVGDEHDHWAWTGTAYADTQPAPAVNLHPRQPATRRRSPAHP